MNLIDKHIKRQTFASLAAISLISYSSMIVLQAFNADDVIQGQPISGDANTFLAQGRWGYYLIYKVFQEANPLGPVSLIIGAILLTATSFIAANTLDFKRNSSFNLFILLSTVSLYYSSVLSFDSTRIAYPVSSLLAILGVTLAWRGRYALAVVCFTISPAIYPASTQLSLTFVFSVILFSLIRNSSIRYIFPNLTKFIICLAAGLLLYIISTKASVFVTGIALSGRSSINPIAALLEYQRIVNLFLGHSIPNGYQMPYFNTGMKVFLWALIGLFLFTIAVTAEKNRYFLIMVAILGMIVSPFALAFATPLDEFSPRALVAFSLVHAVIAAISIEFLPLKRYYVLANSAVVLAVGFVAITAIQINGSAFDDYLSSRNDILATNRIITRIDEVVSTSSIPMMGPIPIVVRYEEPMNMSPRGPAGTARTAPWSKEWIFRQIDPRFAPVSKEVGATILQNAPNTRWPDPRSVYIEDNVVVVIVN